MVCEYCMKYPHDNRCPNAPEPKFNHYCYNCGNDIVDGEEYIVNDEGDYIHYECPSTRELVEFLGYRVQTMRGEYY